MKAAARLDALAVERPEWTPWLRVVRIVVDALADPRWDAGPAHTQPAKQLAPLLAGAVMRPDGAALTQLLQGLCEVAQSQGLHAMVGEGGRQCSGSGLDADAVFLAAVNEDAVSLLTQASQAGASPDGLRTFAALLPMPYLHAFARRWAAGAVSGWSQGYCPVCGAWPAFAENCGIERTRHLRCGRCGCGWLMPALTCTYCATTDHETLRTWVVDDAKSRVALEVCRRCSGYLKSLTTLQPTPSDEILAADLASVEFDIAAHERGFRRPPGAGVALRATLACSDCSAAR